MLVHIEAGRQIVVLLHSYGGMVGSSAAHDLSFSHRQSLGLLGGILTIIYLAAFVVPIGSTLQDMLPNGQWHPWMKFYDDFAFSSNEAELFYNDMPPKDQKYWISRLRHHCKGCYTSPARFEAWKEIPTVYVVCKNDAAVPEVVQRKWIEDMGESCVKVVEIPSSHSPFLSMPGKVKEAIDVAVKIGRKKAGITAN